MRQLALIAFATLSLSAWATASAADCNLEALAPSIDNLATIVRKQTAAYAAGADQIVHDQLKKEADAQKAALLSRGITTAALNAEMQKRLAIAPSERIPTPPTPPAVVDKTWANFVKAMHYSANYSASDKLADLASDNQFDLIQAMLAVHFGVEHTQAALLKYPHFTLNNDALLRARNTAIRKGYAATARVFLSEGVTEDDFMARAIDSSSPEVAIAGIEAGLKLPVIPGFEGGDRVVAAAVKADPQALRGSAFRLASSDDAHPALKNLIMGDPSWNAGHLLPSDNPLTEAGKGSAWQNVLLLLEHGADLDVSVAIKAIQKNQVEVLEAFLDRGLPPNSVLIDAIVDHKLWAVQLLESRGADFTQPEERGPAGSMTPLEVARFPAREAMNQTLRDDILKLVEAKLRGTP